ncbi:MAG TPA: hypothetical protein VH044_11530, partial [Polyangiaceae bacterium]|nr:hypothetical protein [Polyangiaceae bacterium]
MTIASKYTLALLACVVLAVMAYATMAVRRELARSESEIVEHEAATAQALRPAIRDVWLHDGEGRALELIDEAQQRLRTVQIRLVSLDPGAPAENRPQVPAARLTPLEGGDDVTVIDHHYKGIGRIFTYVRLRLTAPSI